MKFLNKKNRPVETRCGASRFPIGASLFPIGASLFPIGASLFPIGASLFPIGASLFPIGASLFPIGASLFPIGASLFPIGASLFPIGASLFPIGASLFRIGASLFRIGASLFRIGASLFPIGASLFPIGASLFRIGASLFRIGASLFRIGASLFRCGASLFPILMLVLSLTSSLAHAQVGGATVFRFLNAAPSARLTGLGGIATPVRTTDPSFALSNPAALNETMSGKAHFSHQFLFADAGAGMANVARHSQKMNLTWHAAAQYMTYGTFVGTDETGALTTNFSATDLALVGGAARQINARLSVGANLRFLSSRLESATALGIGADISGMYFNPERQFGAAITLRNAGVQLTKFTDDGTREALPFDMQMSFSKKLARAPIRLGVIFHDLQRWDLRYPTPETQVVENLFGEAQAEPSGFSVFADNFFRHTIFNTELVFGKSENFRARVAYDHQRRREGLVRGLGGTAGFSFGLGFKVKRFYLDYGSTRFHVAGGSHHLGLTVDVF